MFHQPSCRFLLRNGNFGFGIPQGQRDKRGKNEKVLPTERVCFSTADLQSSPRVMTVHELLYLNLKTDDCWPGALLNAD